MRRSILLMSFLAASANAATYKWIGADGQVNYGDRPPNASARPLNDPAGAPAAEAPGDARLPYALRAAVSRYPVVLYTSRDCGVCATGREHLTKRGIPFTERLLRTQADVDALKARGFAEFAVPVILVGREKAAGYEPGGWDTLLDAAGYPKTSMLPRQWRSAPTAASAAEGGAPAPATAGAQLAGGAPERGFAQPERMPIVQPARARAQRQDPASSLRF